MNLARRFNAGSEPSFRRVASATPDKGRASDVADATWTIIRRSPALKRRARVMPPLRVENLAYGSVLIGENAWCAETHPLPRGGTDLTSGEVELIGGESGGSKSCAWTSTPSGALKTTFFGTMSCAEGKSAGTRSSANTRGTRS